MKTICEPFCGKGNLVAAMRKRGVTVHASDIQYRGCPDSITLDFLKMTRRPKGCDVLLSNPPHGIAMDCLERAFALGFRLVILLLKTDFLNTDERYQRLHPRGHLRRVHVLAERLQDMHDAAYLANGGSKASQIHVFDRNHCGPAEINPMSIKDPMREMPWQTAPRCGQCNRIIRPKRSTARFCSDSCSAPTARELA